MQARRRPGSPGSRRHQRRSLSETAGAPVRLQKFCATSSQTSEDRLRRGCAASRSPRDSEKRGEKGPGGQGEPGRDPGQRGRGTGLAPRGPRRSSVQLRTALCGGLLQTVPARDRGLLAVPEVPLRYVPEAAGSLAAAIRGWAGSRRLSQPGSEAGRVGRRLLDCASVVSRLCAVLHRLWQGDFESDLRFQRCFLSSARRVPGLVAWLPSRPGQPLGAGRRRRGPACSLERPDGNTL